LAKRASERFREIAVIKTKDDLLKQVGTALIVAAAGREFESGRRKRRPLCPLPASLARRARKSALKPL